MTLPKISCFCPTYNRPRLLEEALQCFLLQDYPAEKELIILNDAPGQKLAFNHPQVRVVNLPTRAPSQIDKYNYAVSFCTGDILTPWDDDDIFLPNRLSMIASNTRSGLYASDYFWTDVDPDLPTLTIHQAHCNHAWTIPRFIRFGAYKFHPEKTFDFLLSAYVRAAMHSSRIAAHNSDMPTYLYRKFSVATDHISTHICQGADYYEKYAEACPITETGDIHLNPHWTRDWLSICERTWASRPTAVPLDKIDPDYKPTIAGQSYNADAATVQEG